MPLTQEEVRRIVLNVEKHGQHTAYVADLFNISQRRVQQLATEYRKTGSIPVLQSRGRKPYASYPLNIEELVRNTANRLHAASTTVGKYLRRNRNIQISNNKVCEIMKSQGLSRDDYRKRGRKKPWIRYERTHPLSAVHIDWHLNSQRKQVCAVTDDCSRMILAIGEFDGISSDDSIKILKEGKDKYSHIRDIQQVISDHGSEFYATRRDKAGNADHKFEKFCREQDIQQVLCRVKHPQTNGKIEKFFHIYDQRRWEFDSLDEFTQWYNCIRPHMSLDFDNLETPEQAFYKRLKDVLVGNYVRMIENLDQEGVDP